MKKQVGLEPGGPTPEHQASASLSGLYMDFIGNLTDRHSSMLGNDKRISC